MLRTPVLNDASDRVIEVENLGFTYPGKEQATLQGISFTIQQGEIFGFLGPSGAGKSTTQKILMRLLNDYEGDVSLFGKSLKQWGREYYERIGVSFELPNHYQKLTALENLQFFRSLYNGKTEEPLKLLEMVGLGKDANLRVSQFSKGMQSRLTFVRSLLNQPDLIFLDEPTSGLDPANASRVKDIIRDLQKEGRTIFLTTHDMHIAEELCDRVAFIINGKIAVIDQPYNLKLAHSKRTVHVDYVKGNEVKKAVFTLDELRKEESFFEIIRNHQIKTMHTQEASLEDIFISVTGERLT